MTNWENIEVPAGSYIGWGTEPGQTVIGKVLGFNMTGGTDFGRLSILEVTGDPQPKLVWEYYNVVGVVDGVPHVGLITHAERFRPEDLTFLAGPIS